MTLDAHPAADVTAAPPHSAAKWQAWALGLSDALLHDAAAPSLRQSDPPQIAG